MFSDERVTAPWFTLEVIDCVCVYVCVCVCVCVCICLALQETQKPLYQPCSGVLLQQAGLGFAQRSSHTDSHTVGQDIPGGLPPCGHQNSLHCGASHRLLGPPEVSSGDRGALGGLPALLREVPLHFHHVIHGSPTCHFRGFSHF